MARNLRNMNRDGRGQEDADDLMADIMLACTAIGYVAEFAWINAGLSLCREVARNE